MIAGNATIGAEILEDLPDVEAVVVPFGGGGLDQRYRLGDAALRAHSANDRRGIGRIATRGSGPRTWTAGHRAVTFKVSSTEWVARPCSRRCGHSCAEVDAAVCVSFAQITDAIRVLAARHHVIAEAAGAASVAAAHGRDGRDRRDRLHHFRREY